MKCGNYMPWDTGLCTSCRNAMEAANARKMDEEKKKRQAQQPQPRAESPTIHYSFTGYFKKHQYKSGNLYSGSMQSGYRHGKGKFTRGRITSPTTATGTWASAMAAARRKCQGSGGFPASFITISETASAGSFAPTAKATRANGRTTKSTATAGKPMREEAGTRANGSTAGARGRASIITLDAQGALHGEMLSADVDGFLKDFAW